MKVVVLALLLALTACTDAPRSVPSDAQHSPRAAGPSRRTLEQIVHDPQAVLLSIRIAGTGNRSVTSAWAVGRRRAIVHSEDGFATAHFMRWSRRRAEEWMPSELRPLRPRLVGLDGSLTWPVPRVGHQGIAVLGGGDGATLFPLERVARFTGRRWRAYDVPSVDGEQGYTGGGAVLADGRLLVLLDHWSGDLHGRPSARWHGLWISDGDDWTSYRPWRPQFAPALEPTGGWSPLASLGGTPGRHGLLWVTTTDARAYVSEDGESFQETRIR